MELKMYKSLVEDHFGPIKLPQNEEEIINVLEALSESMEVVSQEDYHLFQAIMIINEWRNNREYIGREDEQDKDRRRK